MARYVPDRGDLVWLQFESASRPRAGGTSPRRRAFSAPLQSEVGPGFVLSDYQQDQRLPLRSRASARIKDGRRRFVRSDQEPRLERAARPPGSKVTRANDRRHSRKDPGATALSAAPAIRESRISPVGSSDVFFRGPGSRHSSLDQIVEAKTVAKP